MDNIVTHEHTLKYIILRNNFKHNIGSSQDDQLVFTQSRDPINKKNCIQSFDRIVIEQTHHLRLFQETKS